MTPRQTEQVKLSATYLNGIAVAVFAVGGFAPLFAPVHPRFEDGTAFWVYISSTLGCWIVSGSLHYRARRILDRLSDDEPSGS